MTRLPTGGALTVHYTGRARELHHDVHARATIDSIDPIAFDGLWDTGATNTVVGQCVVDKLGLSPTGVKDVFTPQGSHQTPSYIVDLFFPGSKLQFTAIEVTLGKLSNCDILIGMDVIGYGDFSVTNKNDITVMSFRVPSMQTIDYVERLNSDQKRFSKLSKTKQRRILNK